MPPPAPTPTVTPPALAEALADADASAPSVLSPPTSTLADPWTSAEASAVVLVDSTPDGVTAADASALPVAVTLSFPADAEAVAAACACAVMDVSDGMTTQAPAVPARIAAEATVATRAKRCF